MQTSNCPSSSLNRILAVTSAVSDRNTEHQIKEPVEGSGGLQLAFDKRIMKSSLSLGTELCSPCVVVEFPVHLLDAGYL